MKITASIKRATPAGEMPPYALRASGGSPLERL